MDQLLKIEGLAKRFGGITAVDGIDFTVGRGEVLGFLGPNGAGKSTTMRMVAGYLTPSAGRVEVCGFDVATRPIEVRRRLGYLPEGAPAYGDMTPEGIFRFTADIRGLGRAERRRRIDGMVQRLELESVFRQPIDTLSKGFKRRVGLGAALLHDPDVLILDEPTDGLDPNQKHQVRTLLAELAADKAIIISTHILEEVDAICSRAIIIAKGRIVADAKPDALLARSRHHNAVSLRLPKKHLEKARALLQEMAVIAAIEEVAASGESAALIALPRDGADIIDAVRATIGKGGVAVEELHLERGRLDDVFRDLTRAA
jgi:ABC-2 type transport system ATP-binding protein